jgi:hypothetical protein
VAHHTSTAHLVTQAAAAKLEEALLAEEQQARKLRAQLDRDRERLLRGDRGAKHSKKHKSKKGSSKHKSKDKKRSREEGTNHKVCMLEGVLVVQMARKGPGVFSSTAQALLKSLAHSLGPKSKMQADV